MKRLSALFLAACILLSFSFCSAAASVKSTAKSNHLSSTALKAPVASAKADYSSLVKQFNKESNSYNPSLKKVRDFIIKAGTLETYLETVDFPHESKAVTIKTDFGNIKAYKTTNKCGFKSLADFYKALSQYWSDGMVKKLKDYAKGRYYDFKGAIYVDSNICDESMNMPIKACTVKLIKKYGDGSAQYTVRLARSNDYFNSASKTDITVKNYSGKLKLNTMLGGTGKKAGGNCETYIIDKSELYDQPIDMKGYGKCFEKALEAAINGDSKKAAESFSFSVYDSNTVKDYITAIQKSYSNYKLLSCTESDLNCLAENANYEVITDSKIQLTDKKGKVTVRKVKKVMTLRDNQELCLIGITID